MLTAAVRAAARRLESTHPLAIAGRLAAMAGTDGAADRIGAAAGASTSTPSPPPPFRVLFCGPDMALSYAATAAALAGDAPRIQVIRAASREEGLALLPSADLAVPLMTALPGTAIAAAAPSGGTGGRLRTILQYGVGVEGVDVGAAAAAGVAVKNIPSSATANAAACAEMALLLALGLLRRLPECAASVRRRVLGNPPGRTLAGKTALVLGFGGIAVELIPRLAALGVRVTCARRSAWEGEEEEEETAEGGGGGGGGGGGEEGGTGSGATTPAPPTVVACYGPTAGDAAAVAAAAAAKRAAAAAALAERGRWSDVPSLAAAADLIFLAVPQTPATAGLVGQRFWRGVKRGALLINVCRGGLVDPDAAVAALEDGTAGGLGLDVTWEEPAPPGHALLAHERVIVTPHVGGVTEESYGEMAEIVAGEARAGAMVEQ